MRPKQAQANVGHDIIVIGTSEEGVAALSLLPGLLPWVLPAVIHIVFHLRPESPYVLHHMLGKRQEMPGSLQDYYKIWSEEIKKQEVHAIPDFLLHIIQRKVYLYPAQAAD